MVGRKRSSLPLGELVTVAVSPRERHYSIVPSLLSLFATIPADVRVIVAQGDIPSDLRLTLNELKSLREFDLIETEYPLYPQEARNLGVEASTTDYIVIADNDIEYEAGWLEALVGNAVSNRADIVAPLIFIGPPRAKEIHHAGGRIQIMRLPNGLLKAIEVHQLSHKNIEDVDPHALGVANHTVEFHNFLVSASYLKRSGGFDERMTTQEQIHYGLLAFNLGAKVTFEADARVTYNAKRVFHPLDLQYLSFRWNGGQAIESMRAIEAMWGIHLGEEGLLTNWICRHRARAYSTFYTEQAESMTMEEFFFQFVKARENKAMARARKLRNGKTLNFVDPIDASKVAETIAAFTVAPAKAA